MRKTILPLLALLLSACAGSHVISPSLATGKHKSDTITIPPAQLWAAPQDVRALEFQPSAGEGLHATVHKRTGERVEIPTHDIEGLPRNVTAKKLQRALDNGLKPHLTRYADGTYRLTFRAALLGGMQQSAVLQRKPTHQLVYEYLQKKGQVETTEKLVRAFNTTQGDDRKALRQWLRAYIAWFKKQALPIDSAHVAEYATLAAMKPQSERERKLMRLYFGSLTNKISQVEYQDGEATIIEALADSLPLTDPKIFQGKTEPLTRLCDKLITKLARLKADDLKGQNYAAHSHTLEALHQALAMLRVILQEERWSRKEGHYARFRKVLEQLEGQASYYPYKYQVTLVKQSLERLKAGRTRFEEVQKAIERVSNGVKGTLQIVKGLKGLLGLEIDVEAFRGGIARWQEAIRKEDISKKKWYEQLARLAEAALFVRQNPQDLGVFKQVYAQIAGPKAVTAPSRWKQFFSGKEDHLAFGYGVVQQLVALGLDAPTLQVGRQCEDYLKKLSQQAAWKDYSAISEAVETGLKAMTDAKRMTSRVPPVYDAVFGTLQLVDEQAALKAHICREMDKVQQAVRASSEGTCSRAEIARKLQGVSAHLSAELKAEAIGVKTLLKDTFRQLHETLVTKLTSAEDLQSSLKRALAAAEEAAKKRAAGQSNTAAKLSTAMAALGSEVQGQVHALLQALTQGQAQSNLQLTEVRQRVKAMLSAAEQRLTARAEEQHQALMMTVADLGKGVSAQLSQLAAKQQELLTADDLQQALNALQLGPQMAELSKCMEAIAASALTKAELDGQLQDFQAALKEEFEELRDGNDELQENLDAHHKQMLQEIDLVRKQLDAQFAQVRGMIPALMQQFDQKQAHSAKALEEEFKKHTEGIEARLARQHNAHSGILRASLQALQKNFTAKLHALEAAQQGSLTKEGLLAGLATLGLDARFDQVLQAIQENAIDPKHVDGEFKKLSAQLASESEALRKGHLANRALIEAGQAQQQQELKHLRAEIKRLVAIVTQQGPVPAEGAVGPRLTGSAEYAAAFKRYEEALIKAAEASRGTAATQQEQGDRRKDRGRVEPAKKKYQNAIWHYQRALDHTPAWHALREAIQQDLDAVQTKLAAMD